MVPRRELELAQSEVHALEAEARNLKAKLNESVPKEDYAVLRQQGDELRAESTRLKAQLKDMVARVEFDAQVDELAESRLSVQRLSQTLKGMVPREDLDAASHESKLGRERVSSLEEQLGHSNVEVEALKGRLQESVARSELKAAQANCQVLEEDKQRSQEQVEVLKQELSALKLKLKQVEKDRDDVLGNQSRMCNKEDLHAAQSELSGAQANVEALDIQLSSAQAQLTLLKKQLQEKKDEVQGLRTQMEEMVSRKDLAFAKGQVHSVQMENTSKDRDIAALREQHKQQVQASGALRVMVDEMRTKMAELVPRTKLLAAQAEAKSASEEAQLKIKELAAMQETLNQARAEKQALHGQVDSLRAEMAELVPRSQLLAAKTEAKKLEEDSNAKDAEIASLKSLNADVKEKANSLRKDVDDVNAQLSVAVPKAQLLATQEELCTSKDLADAQSAEIARLENLVKDLRVQLNACHEELDRLKSSGSEKVPRVELLDVQAQLRELKEKLAASENQEQSLQAHNSDLKRQQTALREEIVAWKEKAAQMVPRAELMAEKSKARAQTELVADVQAQLQTAQADVRKLKEQIYASKQEISVLKESMADLVPRRDYLAAVSDCNKERERKQGLEREMAALNLKLEQAQSSERALRKQVQELENMVGNMAGKDDLAVAQANARKLSYENDTLRSVQEALETQIKSLKARLANSVDQDVLAAEQSESNKVREELRALRQQLHNGGLSEPAEFTSLVQALSDKPAISPCQATELLLAVRSLQRGGVDETVELVKCIAARSPATSPLDVKRLVSSLEGPPTRSMSDVPRLLRCLFSLHRLFVSGDMPR